MEIVQYYSDRYHQYMDQLNILKPSIEPRASGHIIEQIELVKKIIEAGFAYESHGSVYFDVEKFSKTNDYGKLSGRILEDLLSNTRVLDGQHEKHNSADFALWKNASPEHIMRWPSPWGDGFPGWHAECSAMSVKYLGEHFDIHGGGMDLLFPHHEAEIAQSKAALGHEPVHYWMHNNMITINGQKMGKSLGNFITLEEFFTGTHKALERAYSPMIIRFFILQAHYRSPLDFSNEALQAAEKGMKKLFEAGKSLQRLLVSPPEDNIFSSTGVNVEEVKKSCYDAMDDDFNSPILIASLFEIVRIVNSVVDKKERLSKTDLLEISELYNTFVFEVLGLSDENTGNNADMINGLMNLIIELRAQVRANKDYATSDKIRDELGKLRIQVKDGKEGATWSVD
jgi:cysteinyl-tRNA synthetase